MATKASPVMFDDESMINSQIRIEIRRRTRHVRTRTQLVTAIFDSFRHSQVDWRSVSLEDMKTAVLIAARAVRERGGESPENMPA